MPGTDAWDRGARTVVDDISMVAQNRKSEPIDGLRPFVMVHLDILVRPTRAALGTGTPSPFARILALRYSTLHHQDEP